MNQQSIKKLKRTFNLSATLAYVCAMIFMGGLIYITNLVVTQKQILNVLNYIVENEGDLPEPKTQSSETNGSGEGEEKETSEDTDSKKRRFRSGNEVSLGDIFATGLNYNSPEFHYSTRFFSVIFDENEDVLEVKTNHIAAVEETEAVDYAREVLQRMFSFGTTGVYFYKKAPLSGDRTIVVYLDSRNQLATSIRLLYLALIIMGLGMVIVLILLHAFSDRLIQPEIENARRQEQFITNASHELKTPLAVIKANTEVEQILNGENEWNQSTIRQVNHMTGLIQNLVMISRAREKEDNEPSAMVDVTRTVSETVDTFLPVAEQDGKKLEKNLAENVSLLGRDSEVRQLVSLLLDNAIKYCDEKGRIIVALQAKGKHIRLAVSNSYAEGEETDYSRFFDRFYRKDESHNIDQGGYGIGLSIAESLTEKYKGSISASWKDGMITFLCVLSQKRIG